VPVGTVRTPSAFSDEERKSTSQRYRRIKKALTGPSTIAFSARNDGYVLRLSME
jgi:methionine synthase II (cobalamin-independent)